MIMCKLSEQVSGGKCLLPSVRQDWRPCWSPRPAADDPWKHPKGWTGRTAGPRLSLDEGEGNARINIFL
jgi:hypothetical protein